jgi:hypothetical protein
VSVNEQFGTLLLIYGWGGVTSTGLVYAWLGFVAARGQRWRWRPPLLEIGLVLLATLGTFASSPTRLLPYCCQAAALVLEPCVLVVTLQRARRDPAFGLFMFLGWWLLPLLLWFPGMFALGPVLGWLLQLSGPAWR